MRSLNVGDVVSLKSGGPEMVITYIEEEDEYCTLSWYSAARDDIVDAVNVPLACITIESRIPPLGEDLPQPPVKTFAMPRNVMSSAEIDVPIPTRNPLFRDAGGNPV